MKKFFSLLALMLLCSIGAMAQMPFTSSSSYDEALWYYWKLGDNYIKYNASANADKLEIGQTLEAQKEDADVFKWAFINVNGKVRIMNKAAGSGSYLFKGTNPGIDGWGQGGQNYSWYPYMTTGKEGYNSSNYQKNPNNDGTLWTITTEGKNFYLTTQTLWSETARLGNKDNYLKMFDATTDNLDLMSVEAAFNNSDYVTFTYKYVYNGAVKSSESVTAKIGVDFPESTYVVPFGTSKSAVPSGKVTAESNDQTYTIELSVNDSYPFEFAASYENIEHWYSARLHSNQTHYMYNNNGAIAFSGTFEEYNKNYGWAFVGDPFDGFKIYNKAAGSSVMLSDDNPCSLTEAENKVKIYASKESVVGGFCMKTTGYYYNFQNNSVARWNDNDAGSTWRLIEIDLSIDAPARDAKAEALVQIASSSVLFGTPDAEGSAAYIAKQAINNVNYDNTDETEVAQAVAEYLNIMQTFYSAANGKEVIFHNTNRGDNYMVVTDAVQLAGASTADGRSVFLVNYVEGTNGQFTLKNLATGRYIAKTPSTSQRVQLSTDAGKFTIKSWGTDNKLAFISVTPTNATHNSLHLADHLGVVAWEADNEGNASVWNIEASEITPDQLAQGVIAVKQQAYVKVANAKPAANFFGEGFGKYTKNDDYNATEATIDAKSNDLDFEEILALQTTLGNKLKACLNMPQAGTFLRMKSNVHNSYISVPENHATGSSLVMSTIANNDNIFYFDNGKLVAYSTGYYVKENDHAQLGEASVITFAASNTGALGTYSITSSGKNPWYSPGETGNINNYSAANHNNCNWVLEEVTELPVTIGSTTFATFYTPSAVAVPANVTAYVCNLQGEELKVYSCKQTTTIEGTEYVVIPANTAVMLKATAAGTYNFKVVADDVAKAYENNSFFGDVVTKAFAEDYDYYSLQPSDDGVAFLRKPSGNFQGFRAFLKTDKSAQSLTRFNISFEDDAVLTGITDALGIENVNIPAYDLSGRRVNANNKDGFYIINGKKIIK